MAMTSVSGLRYTEGKFTSRRYQQLFYCAFFPNTPVRAVVLFLHGVGEHSHRFKHVYEYLCSAGYGVIAYDMISHGRSDDDNAYNTRAHGEQFVHFVDDTNDFITLAKFKIFPEMVKGEVVGLFRESLPLVFMGISFGSLVGLHTILSGRHKFSAAVLASPAVAVELTMVLRVQAAVGKPLSWLMPTARIVPGVNFAGLTRDPEFLADYMNDPLNMTENLSARMGEQILEAMTALQNDLRVEDPQSVLNAFPLLIVQGTEDIVTSVSMARGFFDRLGNKDKEFRDFPGLFHCIFNEPEKQEVLDYIAKWLNTRIPAARKLAAKL